MKTILCEVEALPQMRVPEMMFKVLTCLTANEHILKPHILQKLRKDLDTSTHKTY